MFRPAVYRKPIFWWEVGGKGVGLIGRRWREEGWRDGGIEELWQEDCKEVAREERTKLVLYVRILFQDYLIIFEIIE